MADPARSGHILVAQDGVMTTAQADAAFGRAYVRHQVDTSRWQRPGRGVVVAHNGPLTVDQRSWVALLSCPLRSALGGLTALRFDGFKGFEPHAEYVVLPEGARRPTSADLVPHFSTMLGDRDVHPSRLPRRTRPQRSLVDHAAWCDNQRFARLLILAGVQQRLVRTRDLREALTRRGPCRNRALIVESILDAAGGIQSLPEHDFDQIRAARRLPTPTRQAVMRRADGKYYLDVEWKKFDTACEIHGMPHLGVGQWDSDIDRANEITIAGPRLLVFSSFATRRLPDRVADQLERMLVRGGWSRP